MMEEIVEMAIQFVLSLSKKKGGNYTRVLICFHKPLNNA